MFAESVDAHQGWGSTAARRVAVLAALGISTLAGCSSAGSAGLAAPGIGTVAAADVSATTAGPPRADGNGKPECVGPATATSQPIVEPIVEHAQSTLPVTYTDVTGQPVTVDDTSRILALDTYGTLGSTVYALGFGDRLVGRDVSTGIPALMGLPLVTHNGHELNGEAILDLDPSLVITDYSIGPLEVQLQLIDSGIPVVIMSDQRGRDLIGPQIEAVATVLGVPDLGRQLAERVEADVVAAEAHVASLAPSDAPNRLRMVFLYMRGNAGVFYWFGEGSGADDLIESLGGVDVAGEVGLEGMRPINAEGLVSAEPDLYLMMSMGLESVGGIDGLLTVPGVADTTAGQTSCIVDMSDYQVLSFGPQFPSTLRALADAIYTQATVAA